MTTRDRPNTIRNTNVEDAPIRTRMSDDIGTDGGHHDQSETLTRDRPTNSPEHEKTLDLASPMPSEKFMTGKSSSESFADALSSSLADIAAAREATEREKESRNREARDNSSEEGGGQSSSSSSGPTGSSGGSSGPARVTATATTSSGGDDRFSSSTGEHANSSAEASSKQDSSSDSNGEKPVAHTGRRNSGNHNSSQSNRQPKKKESPGKLPSSADGYGLPVPRVDDRLRQAQHGLEHAAVVARLPPPRSDGATNSSGSGAESEEPSSLLQPHREPGFHTIRRTFHGLARQQKSTKSSESDSLGDQRVHHKYAKRSKTSHPTVEPKAKRKRVMLVDQNDDNGGNGSSSGSGTEGGYAGSASSNENAAQASSSPSVSSSEESVAHAKRSKVKSGSTRGTKHTMLTSKQDSTLSMSSEIADFSSGSSEDDIDQGFAAAFRPSPSRSPSLSSTDETEEGIRAKVAKKVQESASRKRRTQEWPPHPLEVSRTGLSDMLDQKQPARRKAAPTSQLSRSGRPPIMSVGCDVMAHILTFLEPPDILDVLTMPLSKDWLNSFTRQPELWRVLCLLDPFKAQVENEDDVSSDDSIDSYSVNINSELKRTFGKFRILYTNFVRCMRYLTRIKEDAMNGRPPSVVEDFGANRNLQQFLARARGLVIEGRDEGPPANSDISDDDAGAIVDHDVARAQPIKCSDDGSSTSAPRPLKRRLKEKKKNKKSKKVKYAHSRLTERLLGPTADGTSGEAELPWSCAIYSIVNWMVAYANVEGIQTMCLNVLPCLLEDEQQRITAQRVGLTDIVLRGMVLFPNSPALHCAAFHTIVLLARPLGGHEGMLFHSSMVNSSGIFSPSSGSSDGRNGIAVMLDSMRRFQTNPQLQAMSCWSLVNIALAPSQKEMLVKLGGIQVTANAMATHPYNAEVQFRALFALINLVIPSVSVNNAEAENDLRGAAAVQVEDSSEKEMLDEMVAELINLVVLAMKNFCASEAILNRACLVLHNLSLTQGMCVLLFHVS